MLSVRDAESTILNAVKPLDNQRDIEYIDLLTANGRILASPVVSSRGFPHWDHALMDGYAVRYHDVQHARADKPVILQVVAEIRTGDEPSVTLESGQAVRIFTGAMIPKGADTVIMQEKTHRQENRVLVFIAPQSHEFVIHQGEFYQAGNDLLPSGIVLSATEIALLAAAGREKVSVFRNIRVAIFSTGNELVTLEELPKPGQIFDSNQYALATLMRQLGAEVLLLGVVPDDPIALEQTIDYAITSADIVISTGGVSVGDYDYIYRTLASLGATIHFNRVKMRPGKPLTFATFPNEGLNYAGIDKLQKLYFGLPGNPGSALVTCWRFVQPAVRKMSGMARGWEGKLLKVKSSSELQSNGKMETYIQGELKLRNGECEFHQAEGKHSSANLVNLAQTNALAILPVGKTIVHPGEEVWTLMVKEF
ncbi:molybdopterin molybdenumtransferase MoeA [Cylindrospermopsis raciborskii S07]|uniref:Molybdopterin molybdenumtransferase n=1 Tax=Cylindrospermopsis raciborskii CS-505 TaxID=533240 RepID=A0A853MC94_9CYAN|nr:gephyrin-like molybdotransferase Glp [Cylindrospermopsis raciborskii]EFA70940.1 Molybdopterin binding domain protein [Cylindrospermopsis raciborskii CS-505]OBU75104.1 molybdopterin molybdenumtransferase [Cylindrospermopsis raciborskii CS-505]PNK06919.1 molybdopterin molybdenumtransferase MoeA [Cylindrospermopsis raciborskii S10]PNK07701.1 molybdopterin molybdenumtransferase MoeA [Cylindrospermopsis raciborskii S07]PNK10974.1 molybdopterin molybdenumtransferase MoeA [Cylindrospermopsis racib